jgi:hypothetical protein
MNRSTATLLFCTIAIHAQCAQSSSLLADDSSLSPSTATSYQDDRASELTKGNNPAFLRPARETWRISSKERVGKKRRPLKSKTVARFMSWVFAKTGWSAEKPPTIVFVSSDRLEEMYYGRNASPGQASVRALFEVSTKTIYLPDQWDADSLRDRGTLLHELTHYLQITNNVKVACNAAYNRKAYQLQMDWLQEQGVKDPREFLEIEDLAFIMLTHCPIY